MADESFLDFVLPLARSLFSDEIPHENSRVRRTGEKDLVVVLEAQDRAFVPFQDSTDSPGSRVPNSDRLVSL